LREDRAERGILPGYCLNTKIAAAGNKELAVVEGRRGSMVAGTVAEEKEGPGRIAVVVGLETRERRKVAV
jgi:hypothetical protein